MSAVLGWVYRWRENASLSLQAGAVLLAETYVNSGSNGTVTSDRLYYSLLPAGGASLSVRPVWNTITSWRFNTALTVNTYVDTVLASVLPRMSITFSATSIITPRVSFQSAVSATTALLNEVRGQPLANNSFPTAASLSAGFSFELRRLMILQVGGQANTLLSYLFDTPVKMGSRELVGMVSLSMQFDPNHSGVNE